VGAGKERSCAVGEGKEAAHAAPPHPILLGLDQEKGMEPPERDRAETLPGGIERSRRGRSRGGARSRWWTGWPIGSDEDK
jgi:hypothetical protein